MVDCGFTEFNLHNDSDTEDHGPSDVVLSKRVSAGSYSWRIDCYPHGSDNEEEESTTSHGDPHLSLFTYLVCSNAQNFNAVFQAFLATPDGTTCIPSAHAKLTTVQFLNRVASAGWERFLKRSELDSLLEVNGGAVRLVCGVMVLRDNPLPVPASDIADHLGRMLDSADGSDVSFDVRGETFRAHRAVLAARSPEFKEELFGSGSTATESETMQRVTAQDIDPVTFKALLRFAYTDALPTDRELAARGDPVDAAFRRLLAAASLYEMDRLKLVCAQRLVDGLSADTVADALHCALEHDCPELKARCMDFFVAENNFKKAVLTEGFVRLGQRFPSIIAELRDRAGA